MQKLIVSQFLGLADEKVKPLLAEIVMLPSFTRLAGISFLGAIERFAPRDDFRTAESRFEHSIGVARLALGLSEGAGLSEGEKRLALVHGLLHDIGHGPFSHSSENFFQTIFSLDHHSFLIERIEDRGSDESKVLRKYGLWFDYRAFLDEPSRLPALEALFFGPMNVDTIEGMVRTSSFFGLQTSLDVDSMCLAVASSPPKLRQLDSFWELKNSIYNDYIFASDQSRYDALICDALFSVQSEVSINDFRLNDEAFEERFHRAIPYQLNLTRVRAEIPRKRKRNFKIKRTEKPRRALNLSARYLEVKGDTKFKE